MPIDQTILTIPPTAEPVTVDQAKLHARIDLSIDDAVVNGMISAARIAVENFCKRKFVRQQWSVAYHNEPPGMVRLRLPWPDVISVEEVSTANFSASPIVNTVITDYMVLGQEIAVMQAAPFSISQWPNPLCPDGYCGTDYTDPYTRWYVKATFGLAPTPDAVNLAILMLVANYYDHRPGDAPDSRYEAEAARDGIPQQVKAILKPYQVWGL